MVNINGYDVEVNEPTQEEWESGIIAICVIKVSDGTCTQVNVVEVDDKLSIDYKGNPYESEIKDNVHDVLIDFMYTIVEVVEDEA